MASPDGAAEAAGPWASPGFDPEVAAVPWRPGDVVECQVHDENGKAQGMVILVIQALGPKKRLFEAECVAASDEY